MTQNGTDLQAFSCGGVEAPLLAARPFRGAWWLPSAHFQTAWGPLARGPGEAVGRLEHWATPDDDFLRVHIHEGEPDRPTMLAVHGLEGSARSPNIVAVMRAAATLGWTAAVFEHRTCGGEMNRARRTYHSGETSDLDFVARRLIERRPGSRLYIVGVSLGGNQLLKWLGDLGEAAPAELAGAAAVSAPYDLTVAGPHLDRAFGGIYARRFLRTLIPKAIEKERQYPGCLDVEGARRARTFQEYDTHVTAALHGFRDCRDYWERCSSAPLLDRIRRPTLLLSSADDPLIPKSVLPREAAARSPFLHPLFTTRGGHVGFVEGRAPWSARYWAEARVLEFFGGIEESFVGE